MAKDVIIACDFPSKDETMSFLEQFRDERPYVKIGMELFYAEGPSIVRELKARGHQIFLDLKLHDIPNTVENAMRSLAGLGVDMTNVHAAGGVKMMESARRGLTREDGTRPVLIAVTQLTSTNREVMNMELGIKGPVESTVIAYAKNAAKAGLDGVVCSSRETGLIHEACGAGFMTVTPGIRLEGSKQDDQHRINTPTQARENGTDYIVVGRPITRVENPVAAYHHFREEFLG